MLGVYLGFISTETGPNWRNATKHKNPGSLTAQHFAGIHGNWRNKTIIIRNLHDYREWVIKSLEEASADELKEDWDYHWPLEDTLRTKVDAWISVTASKIPDNSVNGYDREMLLFDLIAPQK